MNSPAKDSQDFGEWKTSKLRTAILATQHVMNREPKRKKLLKPRLEALQEEMGKRISRIVEGSAKQV